MAKEQVNTGEETLQCQRRQQQHAETMKINIESIEKKAIQYTTTYANATTTRKMKVEMQKLQANQQNMLFSLNKI